MEKTILKNSTFLLLAKVSSKVFKFFWTIFLVRYLGDKLFGNWSLGLSITVLILLFSDPGLRSLCKRQVSRDKRRAASYFQNILVAHVVLFFALGMLLLFISFFLNVPGNFVMLVGMLYVARGFKHEMLFFNVFFESVERFEWPSLFIFLKELLIFLLILLGIYLEADIVSLGGLFTIAHFIPMVISGSMILRRFPLFRNGVQVSPRKIWVLVRKGFPFFLTIIFAVLYIRVDTIILSLFRSQQEVGWYNAAYSFIFFLYLIPNSLVKAQIPSLSAEAQSDKKSFVKKVYEGLYVLILIGVPAATACLVMPRKLIEFLFGSEFLPSSGVLQLFGVSLLLTFLYKPLTGALNASDQEKKVAVTTSSTVIINILLNFWLIPKIGMHGAVISTIVSELILFVTFMCFYMAKFQEHKLLYLLRPLTWSLILSSLMAFVISQLLELHTIILVTAGIAIYLVSLSILAYIGQVNIRMFEYLFSNR